MEKWINFTCEGQKLYGIWHCPKKKGVFPAVVLCHGFTGNKVEAHRLFVKLARRLTAEGISVLRFDFRGSGDSEGDFADTTTSRQIADAKGAIDFICQQKKINKEAIGLLGLSMGGCVAACLSGEDPRIKSLVLWAPAGDIESIFEMQEEYPPLFQMDDGLDAYVFAPVIDMEGNLLKEDFFEDLKLVDPYEKIKNYRYPALIVHGTNDTAVMLGESLEFYRILQENGNYAEIVLIEDADHVFSSHSWEKEAIENTVNFFKKTLVN